MLLLLPLADGTSCGRAPAVRQGKGAGPKVQLRPLEQDRRTRLETDAGYLDNALSGQGVAEGRAEERPTRTDRC